jgi:hypothetical protein
MKWLLRRWGLGRDRVDVHRRSAAAQSLKAEVVEREASEIRKPLQCVARDEELALEVSRRLFDACGGVHHVAVVYDRAPTASHLTRNYRAAVQRSAEARHRAKLALELRRGPRERIAKVTRNGIRSSA